MKFNNLTDSQPRELTAEDVFTGLLDYGLFANKIPPCFTSRGLSSSIDSQTLQILDIQDESKLKRALNSYCHDYIRYQALRDINVPRHLGIPHPESYLLQVLAIKKYWDDINRHNKSHSKNVSRIHARYIGGEKIFEMNYKGYNHPQLEENELEWMAGAEFVVKADISACFPSIYTHSIPWALHGRDESKSKRGLLALSGNLLDQCSQKTRDSQTNGLLIGPHSSNIVSEIILTKIDSQLLTKGYEKVKRHIDDYEFYAKSFDEAEYFLRDLGLALREYELTLNEKKTKILKLPRPSEENWVNELNRFHFPKDEEIKFATVRSFLDLALNLSQTAGTSAPLNYAIKVLSKDQNKKPRQCNDRTKRLYVQEAINLALYYPYLAPLLQEYVFEQYPCSDLKERLIPFVNHLITMGTQRLYPDAIAHGLYYALKHHLDVDFKNTQEIIDVDDCIVNVIFLRYAEHHNLQDIKSKIQTRSCKLKYDSEYMKNLSDDDLKSYKSFIKKEQDRQWILIYQTWTSQELETNEQLFLSRLKKNNFDFLKI
ncbi:MAG: RNA-directed DNA polymerase [Deltaproteobacteria bacterium]|nr:RNA-directed DNA polymerase [Deltaproteobacteria bacterium]